jgi:hypothetical protein
VTAPATPAQGDAPRSPPAAPVAPATSAVPDDVPPVAASAAVEQPPSTPSADANSTPPYAVPQRTAEEVAVALREACESAKAQQRPMLLEFGASWCNDCRRLGSLARIEPLAAELAKWQRVEVNITDPDPHEALLGSFGVRAIAHWEALVPTKCDVAAGRWKRVASRTVEPKRADVATAEQLANWLTTARKRASALR